MPVAVISPGQRKEDDPLEKVANALNIARHGFGIYADMQGLEAAKVQREQALKQQEVENQQKDRGLDIQEKSLLLKGGDDSLQKSKLRAEIAKLNREANNPYNQLSDPDKEIVKDSAKKYSDVAGIKDSIDALNEQLRDPKLSYDQKLALAKSSIKLINSAHTASPDAVGKEEAERAAGFLNPSFKNMLPGMQGAVLKPDLEAFTQQMENLAGTLGIKGEKLKGRVEGATGSPLRSAISSQTKKKERKLSGEDQQAMEWAQANPGDPRAQEIMKRLGANSGVAKN